MILLAEIDFDTKVVDLQAKANYLLVCFSKNIYIFDLNEGLETPLYNLDAF